jgi:hypothetical protein
MFLVQHAVTGHFLAFPEGRRDGCRRDLKPFPPEWTELDHAARFATSDGAALACLTFPSATIVSLDEAWRRT